MMADKEKNGLRKKIAYLKRPAVFLFSFMLAGIILAYFFFAPAAGEGITDYGSSGFEDFLSIAANNCLIIFLIYFSAIFTNKLAYFMYCTNGLTLGIYIGWILKNDISLIMLIIPHGIFEILIILATGYAADNREFGIKNNFLKYIAVFCVHELATLACAGIEAFITPLLLINN